MTADEIAFIAAVLAQLQTAGRESLRVTPTNLVTAGEPAKQEQAHAFLNGFGYLCVRSMMLDTKTPPGSK